ncbi:G0/G1 switch protein 2 [Rhinoraja longicauda]
MGTVSELVPFAREILSQRPNGKMVRIYAVGTALALIGAVLGLLETVCSPFTTEHECLQEAPRDEAPRGERPAGKGTETQDAGVRRHRKHAS